MNSFSSMRGSHSVDSIPRMAKNSRPRVGNSRQNKATIGSKAKSKETQLQTRLLTAPRTRTELMSSGKVGRSWVDSAPKFRGSKGTTRLGDKDQGRESEWGRNPGLTFRKGFPAGFLRRKIGQDEVNSGRGQPKTAEAAEKEELTVAETSIVNVNGPQLFPPPSHQSYQPPSSAASLKRWQPSLDTSQYSPRVACSTMGNVKLFQLGSTGEAERHPGDSKCPWRQFCESDSTKRMLPKSSALQVEVLCSNSSGNLIQKLPPGKAHVGPWVSTGGDFQERHGATRSLTVNGSSTLNLSSTLQQTGQNTVIPTIKLGGNFVGNEAEDLLRQLVAT
jgi:hypothetical protein